MNNSKFAAVLVTLFALVLSPILHGWVLTYLWRWFVVPLGVKELSIAWAIGISVVVSMLTKQWQPEQKDKHPSLRSVVVELFLSPFVFLAFGAIVHAFM